MMLSQSQTKTNLLRAFAGESQARNRYTFAASAAKKEKLHCLEQVFLYTAGQEKEHAEIFFDHLRQAQEKNVMITDAAYPVDLKTDLISLLQDARHNELEEYGSAYPAFAKTAEDEGFPAVAKSFELISKIEGTHAARFELFGELLETGRLFVSDVECGWVCLNCGHTLTGYEAPSICPVCLHDRGYFIRLSLAPWSTQN